MWWPQGLSLEEGWKEALQKEQIELWAREHSVPVEHTLVPVNNVTVNVGVYTCS